ncbi:MAG: L-rhamnose mutarotase [Gemmatimonadetes bacterium]|nr:L-rhamnose mutarotase [Gemmatimonadota bacterium]
MKRAGYIARVKKEGIEEYKRYHKKVWPEMRQALKRAGFHKFTIFMRPNGVTFAYCEVDESLARAFENVSKEEVNARWGAVMAPLLGDIEGQPLVELEEVFNLE